MSRCPQVSRARRTPLALMCWTATLVALTIIGAFSLWRVMRTERPDVPFVMENTVIGGGSAIPACKDPKQCHADASAFALGWLVGNAAPRAEPGDVPAHYRFEYGTIATEHDQEGRVNAWTVTGVLRLVKDAPKQEATPPHDSVKFWNDYDKARGITEQERAGLWKGEDTKRPKAGDSAGGYAP